MKGATPSLERMFYSSKFSWPPNASKVPIYSIHRCVHLLSTSRQHFGCINDSTTWSTPGFEALGFSDIMSLKMRTTGLLEKGTLDCTCTHVVLLPSDTVIIKIFCVGHLELAVDDIGYPRLAVLNRALVECTILLPDGTTVGVYISMEIRCELLIYIPMCVYRYNHPLY